MAAHGGSNGRDRLRGGAEDDVIVGHKGDDHLWGGAGDDAFVFGRGHGRDTIRDFEAGDTIVFSAVSRKEVTLTDTPDGVLVRYGGIGGTGPDGVLVAGVHDVAQVVSAMVFSESNLFG